MMSNRVLSCILLQEVCVPHRRVHISQTTKDSLHGEFELEPGDGGERCEYLLEKGIDTYLVLVSKQVANGLSGNVSDLCLSRKFSFYLIKNIVFFHN